MTPWFSTGLLSDKSNKLLVFCSSFILVGALVILAGWLFTIPELFSPLGMGISYFSTGLMFLLLSVAVVISVKQPAPALNLLFYILCILTLTTAVLSGLCYLPDVTFRLDQLFVSERSVVYQVASGYDGQPSPVTLLCFIAVTLALLISRVLPSRSKTDDVPSWYLSEPVRHIACMLMFGCLLLVLLMSLPMLLAWITGNAEKLTGRVFAGLPLINCVFFLLLSLTLLNRFVRLQSFDVLSASLPPAIAVSCILVGFVFAGNLKNKHHDLLDESAFAQVNIIRQLAYRQLHTIRKAAAQLSEHSPDWLQHQLGHQVILLPEATAMMIQEPGKPDSVVGPVPPDIPPCHQNSRYSVAWSGDMLVISVRSAEYNMCIHAVYPYAFFLVQPWQNLQLEFQTYITYDDLVQPDRVQWLPGPPDQQQQSDSQSQYTYIVPLMFAGRSFNLMLMIAEGQGNISVQDLGALLLLLALGFGLMAAFAIKKLLQDRINAQNLAEANARLVQLESRNRTLLEMAPEAVILVDRSGKILYANQKTFSVFGYAPQALQNASLERLLPENMRALHVVHRQNYARSPVVREMGQHKDLYALHADGHTFPVEIVLSPVAFDDDQAFMAIIRDISDKLAEKQRIKRDLEEKQVLLKEVYHRVKNNMQLIASLLRMQSRSTDHPDTKTNLQEAAQRIVTLALLHERLYRSESLSRISISAYITGLVDTVRQSYVGMTPLEVIQEVDDEEFDPEVVIPIGLILNELITNSIKHAFSPPFQGDARVYIYLRRSGDIWQLQVSDNGRGLPESLDITHSKSLGLKLIKTLTQQLKAELDVPGSVRGCCFIVRIPVSSLHPSASPMTQSLNPRSPPY